jgi:hypothetical protein
VRVRFVSRSGPHLASFRLRTLVAAEAVGGTVGPEWAEADVHVFSKHWHPDEWRQAKSSPCSVFDVCDEHFTSTPDALKVYPWIRDHYYRMCETVDVVTTGSHELARIIREKTGREAVVIEEPPEGPELPAEFCPPLRPFWFGHRANLKFLEECPLPDEMEVSYLCNPDWTPERQAAGLAACNLVLLPQKERWKSANRAVTALRAGRFAVADPVASYDGLCWTQGVKEGIEWVIQNPGSIIARIQQGQQAIRERFDPERIKRQWSDCIWGAANGTSPASSTSTSATASPLQTS